MPSSILAIGDWDAISLMWRKNLNQLVFNVIFQCLSARFTSSFVNLSVIHYAICGAVCFQFTQFLCDDWENIYTLSYYHNQSEVWSITHCLGLGHETLVCTVCLSMFLWICDIAGLLRWTFVSWWYLPRIWPSVTDMQHYYHARYPTDDWHLAYMFLLVCFFHRSVSGRRVSQLC